MYIQTWELPKNVRLSYGHSEKATSCKIKWLNVFFSVDFT